MDRPLLKQECPLFFVVLAWVMYLGGLAVLAVLGQFLLLAAWLIVAPLSMWAYIHWFPAISRFMGYGRLDDVQPLAAPAAPHTEVVLYTALGCPFCPIVKRRLEALEPALGFELKQVDVTARPDILTRKGIWAVPVVEIGDRTIVGHATSEQLAGFIAARKAA